MDGVEIGVCDCDDDCVGDAVDCVGDVVFRRLAAEGEIWFR